MIVWIDFDQEYFIITTNKNSEEINKTPILGKDLYQTFKTTINQIKENYLKIKKN